MFACPERNKYTTKKQVRVMSFTYFTFNVMSLIVVIEIYEPWLGPPELNIQFVMFSTSVCEIITMNKDERKQNVLITHKPYAFL